MPLAKPKPAVQSGGISAVAIATPKITEAIVPFFVRAIIKARPPKNAISTSLISGRVLANNSEVTSLSGNNQKNKKAVKTLNTTMIPKLISDFLRVNISFIAIDIPMPKIGPISGEINMAPITTAVEFAFNPIEATNIEHIKIHAVAPLNDTSFLIASTVSST